CVVTKLKRPVFPLTVPLGMGYSARYGTTDGLTASWVTPVLPGGACAPPMEVRQVLFCVPVVGWLHVTIPFPALAESTTHCIETPCACRTPSKLKKKNVLSLIIGPPNVAPN